MGCIEGAKEVIKMAGYSEETADALEFPPEVQEPDKPKLEALIAELVMAKVEVEMKSKEREGSQSSPRGRARTGSHSNASSSLQHGGSRGSSGVHLYQNLGARQGDDTGQYPTELPFDGKRSQTAHVGSGASSMPYRAGGEGHPSNSQPMRATGGQQPLRAGGRPENSHASTAYLPNEREGSRWSGEGHSSHGGTRPSWSGDMQPLQPEAHRQAWSGERQPLPEDSRERQPPLQSNRSGDRYEGNMSTWSGDGGQPPPADMSMNNLSMNDIDSPPLARVGNHGQNYSQAM